MGFDRSVNVGHRINPQHPPYPSAPVLEPGPTRVASVAQHITHTPLPNSQPRSTPPRVPTFGTRPITVIPTGPNPAPRSYVPAHTHHTTTIHVDNHHSYAANHHDLGDLHGKRAWGVALLVLGIFATIFGVCASIVDPIVTPVVLCGIGLGMMGLGAVLIKSSEKDSYLPLT